MEAIEHQIRLYEAQMGNVTAGNVAAAVGQLNSGKNIQQADQWLQALERSRFAWPPLIELLAQPDCSLQFFAARTLAAKLIKGHSLEQLNGAEQEALRQSLSSHLRRFAAGPAVVRTQLCLAAGAACALDASGLPAEDARAVVQQFCAGLNDGGPNGAAAAVEFLTLLAEEAQRVQGREDPQEALRHSKLHAKHVICASPRLSPVTSPLLPPGTPDVRGMPPASPFASPCRSPVGSPVLPRRSPACLIGGGGLWNRRRMGGRHSLVAAAEATAPSVFAFVSEQWPSSGGPDDPRRASLVRLVSRWLPFCGAGGAHSIVGPLLPHALQGLASAACAEASTDFVVEVAALAAERRIEEPELLRLVLAGVPEWVAGIGQIYRASDMDIQRAVTRAIVAIAEAVCDRILAGDAGTSQVLPFLVECAGHEDSELTAALTYPFWGRLADTAEEGGGFPQALVPPLLPLVDALLRTVRLPDEVGPQDSETDGEWWRFDFASHAVIDVLRLTGLQGLQLAWQRLEQASAAKDWRAVEAALFLLKYMPNNHVAQIAQTALSVCSALPEGWRIRDSYIRIVGRCGSALGQEGVQVPLALLEYIAVGLSDKRTHSEATLAMWLLATQCPKIFAEDSHFAPLMGLLAQRELSDRHVELIAEGVGKAIAAVPVAIAAARIAGLSSAVAARAGVQLQAGLGPGVARELRILACAAVSHGITYSPQSQAAWAQAWAQFWPLVQRLFTQSFVAFRPPLQYKAEAAQAGVEALRGVAKAAGAAMIPHMEPLLVAVAEGVRTDPCPPLLDAITVVVEAEGGTDQLAAAVVEFLAGISEPLLTLVSREGFDTRLALAKSLFGAFASIARVYPGSVFPPAPLAGIMLTCSASLLSSTELLGSLSEHREVLTAALDCIARLLDIPAPHSAKAAQLLAMDGNAAARTVVAAVLSIIDDKAARPLEVAQRAAAPLAAVWFLTPPQQRAPIIASALGATRLPQELCDEFQRRLACLPPAPEDNCQVCSVTTSGCVVACRGCKAMLPASDSVAAALERFYIAAPVNAQR